MDTRGQKVDRIIIDDPAPCTASAWAWTCQKWAGHSGPHRSLTNGYWLTWH